MQFQIKHVILWSRDPKHKPRIVNFEVGRFNVLSGVSRTGKSAMIPIIDYCLGSEKCTIPSQTIRKACEWFGVVVETAEGQKLFARREPGPLRASGEAFISEARVVDIPHAIGKKTSTVDAVKNALNHVSQLSALSFSPDEEQGFRARASFRDLVSFVFQPQNIIANPNVLFYKADIAENREKLRTIFPYVLGAVTPAVLARMHELTDLRRELRRKATELNNAIKVSAEWEAQLETRLARAREFGLIRAATTSISRTEAIDLLRNLLDMAPEPRVTQETVTDAVKELDQLQREENSISREVTKLRRRYSEMTELQHNATEYQAALKVQADRLSAARWLSKMYDDKATCPICGTHVNGQQTVQELVQALHAIDQTVTQIDRLPFSFDREMQRVRGSLTVETERLQAVQTRVAALRQSSQEVQAQQYTNLQVARFLGTLESDIKLFERIGSEGDLRNQVDTLRERISALERQVSEAEIERRQQTALRMVADNAGKILKGLDTERPDAAIALLPDELTIKVLGMDRDDYLSEIGSGSNWLSYHIATILGLQQYFGSLPHNPVPNFIVFDQPSQVYFPKKLVDRTTKSGATETEQELADDDVKALRQAYAAIAEVVAATKMQVIVLDHAASSIWGDIPGIHSVENWRDGEKLVPTAWIS